MYFNICPNTPSRWPFGWTPERLLTPGRLRRIQCVRIGICRRLWCRRMRVCPCNISALWAHWNYNRWGSRSIPRWCLLDFGGRITARTDTLPASLAATPIGWTLSAWAFWNEKCKQIARTRYKPFSFTRTPETT